MKKTLTALTVTTSFALAGTAFAHCTFQQEHRPGGSAGYGTMGYPAQRGGFVMTGGPAMARAAPDIVDTAVSAGSFDTLVMAAQAAGLVDVLKSEGPFTLFAPTDEAFAKLPAGTLQALLADREKLARLLKYHVVPGRLDARTVSSVSALATVEGTALPVDSIRIASTDIVTSNGIIHVVDEVLVPQG